jgi:hypothetical protein
VRILTTGLRGACVIRLQFLVMNFLLLLMLATPRLSAACDITTPSLPDGSTGLPYNSGTLATNGCKMPLIWSLSAGDLPFNVSLQAAGATEVISGTSDKAGNFSFTLHVVDQLGAIADKPLSIVLHQMDKDSLAYLVQFPHSPVDGDGADATFEQRAEIVVQYLACGDEINFLRLVNAPSPIDNNPAAMNWSDDLLVRVMAKIKWLQHHDNCFGTFHIKDSDEVDAVNLAGAIFRQWAQCGGGADAQMMSNPTNHPSSLDMSMKLNRKCLAAQVNYVLAGIQEGDTYPGTDGIPCYLVGTQKGDWDVRMKMLIRILYLDQGGPKGAGGANVLTQAVHDHIQFDLITVDGAPGQDGYSWLACGDHEKSTGSPQDREDENNMGSDFLDSIGDAASWLCKRLVIIVLIVTVVELLAAIPGIGGILAAGVAVVGIAGILVAEIPETENHRLMIESTRFLNNQLLIEDLGGAANASGLNSDQAMVRDWLLKRLQNIVEHDFNEYNSRPYQGYSLAAIQNLGDFASDVAVRNAAQIVLDYSAAKFALGSNQGRRLVPFRRRLNVTECILGPSCVPDNSNVGIITLFQLFQMGDAQIGLGLLANGQIQQLENGLVSGSGASGLGFPATGHYIADPLIADLAIHKDVPYLQFIHHAGYEIYSSSRSALVTAGGIQTDHADPITVGPANVTLPPFAEGGDQWQDVGAGIPTTVILTGDPNGVTSSPASQPARIAGPDFIRIEGSLNTYVPHFMSFQDNLCVWQNFACGINIRIPDDLNQCFLEKSGNWFFLDSAVCPGYKLGPRFFLVLFLVCDNSGFPSGQCGVGPIPIGDHTGDHNAGFLEVVDASPNDSFDALTNLVLVSNPASSLGNLGVGCLTIQGPCGGKYHTVAGNHELLLALRGHQDDANRTGIEAVDSHPLKDLTDWNFAEGNVINAQNDGFVSIKNARLGTELDLDFRDLYHPCRRSGPNQPCIQQ